MCLFFIILVLGEMAAPAHNCASTPPRCWGVSPHGLIILCSTIGPAIFEPAGGMIGLCYDFDFDKPDAPPEPDEGQVISKVKRESRRTMCAAGNRLPD